MNWRSWWEALKSNSIARAFSFSILVHLLVFISIETGLATRFLAKRFAPQLAALSPSQKLAESKKLQDQQKKNEEPVLQFVEVDPQPQAEEPKDAKYYSSAPTQAANPVPRETDIPKIEGNQEKIIKTKDVAKADPKPVTPPPAPPQKEMQPNTKAVAAEPVGDTKQNVLTPKEKAERDLTFDRPDQKEQKARPRTLAEARARNGIIAGEKVKQEGGVKRFALESDLDVKGSPFGSYDAAFIAAVQARWDALLEQRGYVFDHSGKVVIEFKLYKDGKIRELHVTENEVSETLAWACQRAISDPAPYAPFPADLRRLLGKDFRDIRFSFHYQ